MYLGNQLYSSLSQLARQSLLLLIELPAMLTVLEKNYQLEYSKTCTGNVHVEAIIQGYQYCVGLKRAFETLISQQYRSFILTVCCIVVGFVYCADQMTILICLTLMLEIFMERVILKGHAYYRVLLISSIDNLMQYLKIIWSNS